MKKLAPLLAIWIGLLLMGFSPGELRHEMVKLDKVYIAALALTNQGKAEASRKAVLALHDAWRTFSAKYGEANSADKQWTADFAAVENRVAQAVAIVGTPGKDVSEAHEALEDVRNVLLALRQRNHIDYYIDGLTAFHHPMEEIVLAAKDKTAQSLSDADIGKIRSLLPQAEKYWRGVEAAKPDATIYQLSPAQAGEVAKLVRLESAALAGLSEALAAGDKSRIVKAAVAIKPNFAKLFMTFANFEPYQ